MEIERRFLQIFYGNAADALDVKSLMRYCGLLPAAILSFAACAVCEDLDTTVIRTTSAVAVLQLKPLHEFDWSSPNSVPRAGFVRTVTTESFGYSRAPTPQGFEFPSQLTPGPFEAHGLECPHCIIRPTMERARYTLPAFGATSTLKLRDGGSQLFAGFGGVNAWKPDNTVLEVSRRGTWSSSFSDAWLVQGVAGGRVAVDRNRRIWLGVAGRYFENFAPTGPKRWGSFTGTAKFRLGH